MEKVSFGTVSNHTRLLHDHFDGLWTFPETAAKWRIFQKSSFTSVFRRNTPWILVKLRPEGFQWLKGVLNLQRKIPQYFRNSEILGNCAKIWLKLAIFTSYDLHHVSWGIKNPMMHITPQISWTLWCFAFFAFEADLKKKNSLLALYPIFGHI